MKPATYVKTDPSIFHVSTVANYLQLTNFPYRPQEKNLKHYLLPASQAETTWNNPSSSLCNNIWWMCCWGRSQVHQEYYQSLASDLPSGWRLLQSGLTSCTWNGYNGGYHTYSNMRIKSYCATDLKSAPMSSGNPSSKQTSIWRDKVGHSLLLCWHASRCEPASWEPV